MAKKHSTDKLRKRLLEKLRELFQLNQPDLDFGFYRIMHAKAKEVQDFISADLLKITEDPFNNTVHEAPETYGAEDPEKPPNVRKTKAALDAAWDTSSAEADIYDYLYRFFERYYESGDFLSRRYYTRETADRSAPFAVPYNGEEVKLHWANADQYYIKSTEYFSNFSFDLRQAVEIREASDGLGLEEGAQPLRVHFRIVTAAEGEHGNIKASGGDKRYFILHAENPIALNETGELVVHFEYRPDPEKTGQENTWRDKRNTEAVDVVLAKLEDFASADGKDREKFSEYLDLLKTPAPTEKNKNRPLLAKYVNRYTARNTMDYFIHKDLGGFLRRELDFYIKNEIMRLDDMENENIPVVEGYLQKIKVLRNIAHKLIDFLAQLENFQKKLWLKKKFVVETNYCITLDRIPEKMYPDIIANDMQLEEWVRLFSIEEIEGAPRTVHFSRPLTTKFLKENDKLVLDTKFFDEDFQARLIDSVDDFDEQCDGLLVHSENFQALNLLQERYREQVKCIYIDPPYNTGGDGFAYKDSYQHSSWMSFLYDRGLQAKHFLMNSGINFVSISDDEQVVLKMLLDSIYADNYIGTVEWNSTKSVTNTALISVSHTHNYIHTKNLSYYTRNRECFRLPDSKDGFSNPDHDPRGPWKADPFQVGGERPNQMYKIVNPNTGKIYRPNPGCSWKNDLKTFKRLQKEGRIIFGVTGESGPQRKRFWSEAKDRGKVSKTWWDDVETTTNGTQLLKSLFGENMFTNPKPIELLKRFLQLGMFEITQLTLDYFAGSGTTAHAVIDLNREDGGKRKYILVEMGDYFDTVLRPRIAKAAYSADWKDGKPTARDAGVSHCFKYIRLESYEDTLNNLCFDEDPIRRRMLDDNTMLQEDYMLHYLLDVETRGSQSLLNIDRFVDPTSYTLKVKKPGTDEYVARTVDLIETFNYLIGLRVRHTSVPQTFAANFRRVVDPGLPEDQDTKLEIDGHIQQDDEGPWQFRKVEGWVPGVPTDPNNDQREQVLIIWRNLVGNLEKDNLMLDEWFRQNCVGAHGFDIIYVNGSNNLLNLRPVGKNWTVRLIEEEFMRRMWDVKDV